MHRNKDKATWFLHKGGGIVHNYSHTGDTMGPRDYGIPPLGKGQGHFRNAGVLEL